MARACPRSHSQSQTPPVQTVLVVNELLCELGRLGIALAEIGGIERMSLVLRANQSHFMQDCICPRAHIDLLVILFQSTCMAQHCPFCSIVWKRKLLK